MWVCFGRGGIPSCSDWRKIVRCMGQYRIAHTGIRSELVAVAERLWIRGVLWVGRIFFAFFFVFISSYFFERTRLAESMRPPLASYTSLLEMRQGRGSETTEAVLGEKSLFIMRHGRGSEATEAVFRLKAKKPLHAGVRTGCHYVIGLSVCLSACVYHSSFLLIARAVRCRFPQTRDLWKRASMG